MGIVMAPVARKMMAWIQQGGPVGEQAGVVVGNAEPAAAQALDEDRPHEYGPGQQGVAEQ